MELWFKELHTQGAGITLRVKKTLFRERSPYQEIAVLETDEFGKMLVIDGLVMLTERDEFIYHEMMAHPALVVHRNPRRILVIGGGDGGTVREVLRHSTVESVTICEIDELVLKVARDYFPGISEKMYSDARVGILVMDAMEYVRGVRQRFDVILVDSSDPVGPAKGLFEPDFLSRLRHVLGPDGIVVLQSESPFYHRDVIKKVKAALVETGFRHVKFYWAHIPTYPAGVWCWAWASDRYHPLRDLDADRCVERVEGGADLGYYHPGIHRASFELPQYMNRFLGS